MNLVDIVIGERQMQLNDQSMAGGVMAGIVKDNKDPFFLGRVRVLVPAIDSSDPLPWARVAVPAASMASGFYWLPGLEDEVLVAFEHGDIGAPYVIGCLWSALRPPPLPSPIPETRIIRTPLGNQVVITEAPPTITITTADLTQTIAMTPGGTTITSGANTILMTPNGITIQAAANLNLVAGGVVNITAPTVKAAGTAATSIGNPAGPTTVSGNPVAVG